MKEHGPEIIEPIIAVGSVTLCKKRGPPAMEGSDSGDKAEATGGL